MKIRALRPTGLTLAAWILALVALGSCGTAVGAMYDLPPEHSDLVGEIQHIKTKESDTFVKLAREYNVGYRELRLANPEVDPWLPGDGTPMIIPTRYVLPDAPRRGIVINIPEMRVYYYPAKGSKYAGKVVTYPLGIGREGWSTPLGKTTVVRKKANPTWTPPASIRAEHAKSGDSLPAVVAAGPDNPLGQHALYLGIPSYLLHGTNKPAGIGLKVSHGCIRLYPEDIAALFGMVPVGTPVDIVSQPYKIGWEGNTLYIESHPPDANGDAPVHSYTPWVEQLIAVTKSHDQAPVDWDRAQKVVETADGIPEPIGVQITSN
ncbi:L,D-transpeptidase family protein [Salinisphaera aquimarina]|uniref:L,D-transpeptidase family protein n=1 Tax=Salinisphaera aquimarina TaxID=2094031 RepID=A0ABV7EQB5_9GAMM